MKTKIDYCYKLLDSGYSLICINEKKKGAHKWKIHQTIAPTQEEFKEYYDLAWSKQVALVCGFNGVEVIDIDTKVLADPEEKKAFWGEYLEFLKSNIDDFELKFALYRTISGGYHIAFRCDSPGRNQGLALPDPAKRPDKEKEEDPDDEGQLIETRGDGGYVVLYEDNLEGYLSWVDLPIISDKDKDIIFQISRSYGYKDPEEYTLEQPKQPEYNEQIVTCWNDFNFKKTVWDVVKDDFKIVSEKHDRHLIRRHGSDSVSSGSIFKNSGCMFLFSTATCYPHEKLIDPYGAYTYKHHNGDFSKAAKQLYADGYGTRIAKRIEPEERLKAPKSIEFPLDIFPEEIQQYILECRKTLDSSPDYMGSSLIWLFSVIIGNSLQIQVKRGWNEIATVWLAIVGQAGLGKTPSISKITKPLSRANNNEIKEYYKRKEQFDIYDSLDKKEKDQTIEIKQPIKRQFIANDITLEALVDLHQDSKNSVGINKDELASWIKDMNKYRAGSDLEFWLSTWSGEAVNLNRKTVKSSFVDKPLLPVLGGIQPEILSEFCTNENKANGFMDRMLLSYPDLEIGYYNSNEISQDWIDWYDGFISSSYDFVRNGFLEVDLDGDPEPRIAQFTAEAKKEWAIIHDAITDIQKSDTESEYMKSMLPKQKSYIPRFALIIHFIACRLDVNLDPLLVTKESLLKADKLSKYFIAMAKKVKIDSVEVKEVKKIITDNKSKSGKELVLEIIDKNPEISKTKIAEQLGISRQMVHKYLKN